VLITIIQQNGVFVKNKFAKKYFVMPDVKKVIAVFICICFMQVLSAQNNYVTHILKQGESLSMLAQEYNTSVGDIMRLNGMHADTKLVYGSTIKIPSTKTQTIVAKKNNINTNTVVASKSINTSNEITHVVTKGETLYSISKKYNVSIDELKQWNHLADNNAKVGTLLIISDKGNEKFATTQVQKQRVETVEAPQQKEEVVTNNNQDIKAQTNNASAQDIKINNSTYNEQPAVQNENNTTTNSIAMQATADYTGTGYFTSEFTDKKTKRLQNISGISKTFKTASGWSDGKYYILANDIEPGTIVKIKADNGNEVYAKVLWNMGDLKENSGINFRVSNATAAALHEDASSFNLNVSF
jgi:LysM repeat protein